MSTPDFTEAVEEITTDLVAYALSSIRDLLGTDTIDQVVTDYLIGSGLNPSRHSDALFTMVWNELGQAGTYARDTL